MPENVDTEAYIKVALFNYKCTCVQAIASDGFSVFLSTAGDVYTCGKGNFGRLGHGHEMNLHALTKINWFASNGIRIKQIAAGGRHCLALSEQDNALYGWGFNYYHQLGKGHGDTEDKTCPQKLEVGLSYFDKIQSLACGYFNSAIIISYN